MVGVVVRLRLALLRAGLRGSAVRVVGLVLAAVYGVVGVVVVGGVLLGVRAAAPAWTGAVTVGVFSLVTLVWTVGPVVLAGSDMTLDPRYFALLPVRAARIAPALLAAAAVSVGGAVTTVLALLLVVAWSATPGTALAALVAAPVGVLTCLLAPRVVVTGLSGMLATRRFRDAAGLLVALVGLGVGVGSSTLSGVLAGSGADGGTVRSVARVLGWTPLGWAWAVPADVADGAWARAGAHLALALLLVGALYAAWVRLLDRALTSPLESSGGGGHVHGGALVDRLAGPGAAGAVAARTLRYWRRDPRYVAQATSLLAMPVLMVLPGALRGAGRDPWPALLAPILVGLFGPTLLGQALAFDGSALWAHVAAGLRGRDDRAGRVRAHLLVVGPVALVMLLGLTWWTSAWVVLPATAAMTAATVCAGVGAASYAGAVYPGTAPEPGQSPFQQSAGAGFEGMLSWLLTSGLTVVGALPALVLGAWGQVSPAAGWAALAVAVVLCPVVLAAGVRLGGRRLDARWPEVLEQVSRPR